MTLICSAYYFEKSLWSLLDHHGPFLHKIVTTRPRVPWINDEILIAKRHRRKAERRWRATRSGTDLLSLRSCRNRLTFHMNKARSAYYTNFVNENCLNQRKHFTACKKLLNLLKCASRPLHSDPNQLANDFGKFLCEKINSIRLEIARQGSTSDVSESHFALNDPLFFWIMSSLWNRSSWSNQTIYKDDLFSWPHSHKAFYWVPWCITYWLFSYYFLSESVLWLNHC